MPKITYEDKKFTADTLEIIRTADDIIANYAAQGFSLTLRQLYYQFVARGLLANTERNYKRLGSIISDARRAGLIDWSAIVDRTRFLRSIGHWENPQDAIQSIVDGYAINLWEGQANRVEVWIEKDALVGVIQRVCDDNDVPYFACRGYVSDSEMWRAAMRIYKRCVDTLQNTVILHLGDHDPSGIDMTRDIYDRLSLFTLQERSGVEFEVQRIALTMEQIEELSPPPNPAKVSDSRYTAYVDRYGPESWELDALEPRYISDLIQENIKRYRDPELWASMLGRQERERQQIADVVENWELDS